MIQKDAYVFENRGTDYTGLLVDGNRSVTLLMFLRHVAPRPQKCRKLVHLL
jgi:hypothetical protein